MTRFFLQFSRSFIWAYIINFFFDRRFPLTLGSEDSEHSPRQTDHIKQNTKQKFNVITVCLNKKIFVSIILKLSWKLYNRLYFDVEENGRSLWLKSRWKSRDTWNDGSATNPENTLNKAKNIGIPAQYESVKTTSANTQRVRQSYNIFYFSFLEKFHVATTQQTLIKIEYCFWISKIVR